MAYSTQGFQVRQMPVYTAPNPNLVAFNPTAISDGMGQAFRLAQQYEDLKSKKALQAELQATREARIAQQNALANFDVSRVGAETPLLGPRADLEGGRIANSLALLEPELNSKKAGLGLQTARDVAAMPNVEPFAKYEGEKIAADLSLLGPQTQEKLAQSAANRADADTSVALSGLKRGAMGAQMELATLQSRLAQANAPIEAQLAALKASQKLGSAKTDQEYQEALREADLQLKKSMVEENKAQAAYALGLGRQAAGRGVQTPIQRAKDLQDLIRELDSMKVGDGKRTIGSYIEDTFEADGKTRKKNWFTKDPALDPVADFYIAQRQAYQDELLSLREQVAPSSTGKGLPPSGKAGKLEIKSIKKIE